MAHSVAEWGDPFSFCYDRTLRYESNFEFIPYVLTLYHQCHRQMPPISGPRYDKKVLRLSSMDINGSYRFLWGFVHSLTCVTGGLVGQEILDALFTLFWGRVTPITLTDTNSRA